MHRRLVLDATGALQSREGGLIRITVRNDGGQVEIVVADNRPGMAPDALAGDPLLVASEVLRLSGGTLAITLPQWRPAPAPQQQ